MADLDKSYSNFSGLSKYRYRTILYIAIFWTIIDAIMMLLSDLEHLKNPVRGILLREVFVFVMSLILGYLFVFTLKKLFRKYPLWLNFIFKSVMLLLVAFFMNFLVHFIQNLFIQRLGLLNSVTTFMDEALQTEWLIQKTFYWVILFIVTQLYMEINEKYSPGVFVDILMGKYFNPKVENRIVMFLDLKDSTPIAEKLGHQQYFLFIREFIYHVSMALIEYNGRIYQYVGDEIVVSWVSNKKSVKSALASVIAARKNIQKNSERFRRAYNIIPEFRVGIHIGDVTVGEIGIIKKDLAMSGDTMNTTARIRSACNELNQKFIVSKEFIDFSEMKEWQSESLGIVDLKGKATGLELYSLKI
ncbi:MAG: adenylate/guanylate cyclase domain-containing protein [Ferruginibacter sp.]